MNQQFEVELLLDQRLKLTPSTVLSFKLLQLPIVSLEEFLKNEIESNPLIEPEDDTETAETVESENLDFIFEGGNVFIPEEQEETDIPSKEGVYEKLKHQIFLEFEGRERDVALYILENIDRRGTLLLKEDEIAAKLNVPLETVKNVRNRFKRLSPAGCGSYSLIEILQVQLEEMGADRKLIASLLHLECISSPSTFLAKTGLSKEEFQQLISYLKRCDTRPAESGEMNTTIRPDARVWLNKKGEVEVKILNPINFNFRINSYYLKYASREELRKFIQEKYQRAIWLRKAIEQRRETLQKVLKTLFTYQREFLKDGKTIKPLTLSDIASCLKIHESTVSRSLKDKLIETPFGTFPSRFFFRKTSGSSSEKLKEAIREIIECENKEKPYSDSKIAQILKEKGFKIARRTITKYRKEMGIPGASGRRIKKS